MRRLTPLIALIVVLNPILCKAQHSAQQDNSIAWQNWSDNVFKTAAAQHKFVLLDLQATWCHWCHVMDAQTYSDPAVISLINSKYLPVRVDADSRPDLANRYEDYGWPATVVFNSDGSEIVKRRGFIDPAQMASMLKAIIADPTPGPSVLPDQKIDYSNSTTLTPDLRANLLTRFTDTYDNQNGAWGHDQKFLNPDSVEWSLRQSATNPDADHMVRQTLDAQLNLLDPAWGGVYQYSTNGDWKHPHFEKIMQMQSGNLRIYSLAYAHYHEDRYLAAATAIHHYLATFLLQPNGAFYTSQDADLIDGVHSADFFQLPDQGRRKQGIPRIDKHQYARENGWAIQSITSYYEITADQSALQEAISAANWIIAHRSLDGGGFSRDQHDPAGPYLADTLAMGQAFLELYAATADRDWLQRAQAASDFITVHFVSQNIPAIATSDVHAPSPFPPKPELDENVAAARWANLLNHYTARKSDADLATRAMKYLATPAVALTRGVFAASILLPDSEINSEPLHIVIVGSKSDPAATSLFKTAMTIPTNFKRLEWYDRSEAPLPNAAVEYPILPKPAAFLCTGSSCSAPAFTPTQLNSRIARAFASN